MLHSAATPDGHPYQTVRPPLSVGGPARYSRGAPALGQHTAEVLGEFGLPDVTVNDLLARGIVAG